MAQKIIKGPVDDNSLNSANHNFTELYNMKNVLQTQINDLVLDAGKSDQEVAQARGGHKVLADRLNETDTQLEHAEHQINDTSNQLSDDIRFVDNKVKGLQNQVKTNSVSLGNWVIERNDVLNTLDFKVVEE